METPRGQGFCLSVDHCHLLPWTVTGRQSLFSKCSLTECEWMGKWGRESICQNSYSERLQIMRSKFVPRHQLSKPSSPGVQTTWASPLKRAGVGTRATERKARWTWGCGGRGGTRSPRPGSAWELALPGICLKTAFPPVQPWVFPAVSWSRCRASPGRVVA